MSTILKSTAVVSGLTMLSRILGLVRDMVLMSVFGAGGMMDAFLVAFKIPNFFRRLFAEGAFSQAFVPVLTEYQTQKTDTEQNLADTRLLISQMAGVLLLILSALTAIVIVLAPLVISVFAVGFLHEPAKFATAVELLRITFPYLLFISMTAFASSILQSVNRFVMPAFAPVLLNLTLIVAAVCVSPWFDRPIMALGYAVAVAGLLQLLIQLPHLHQEKLLVKPSVGFVHDGVRRILRLMLPAIFGISVTQINLLVNTLFASLMVNGSVSWLYTAERLSELPLGLIGVAIGTVILPSLSVNATSNNRQAFQDTLDWALKWVMLIGLPASTAIFMISDVMMWALFGHGQFSEHDTQMSGFALQCLSGGVLGFMLIKVFAPAFFARQDSKTPVKVGIIAMLANILLSFGLMKVFAWQQLPQHGALALANSLASFINAGLLYVALHRQQIFRLTSHWQSLLLKLIFANALMAGGLWWAVGHFPIQVNQSLRVMALLGICVLGAVIYAVAMLAMGFKISDLKPKDS